MQNFYFSRPPKEDCIIIKSCSKSHPPYNHFLVHFSSSWSFFWNSTDVINHLLSYFPKEPPKSIRIPKVCRLQKKVSQPCLSDTLEYRLNADTYLLDPLLCTTPNVLAVQMVTVCPHFVKMQFSFGCRTSTTRASSLPPLFRVFRADGDNDYATIKRCPPAEKTTIS